MQRGAKVGIGVAVVCAAMLAGAGFAVSDVFGGGGSTSTTATTPDGSTTAGGATTHTRRTVVSTPPAPARANAAAKAFLDAWSSGNLAQAAALTDDPAGATSALQSFHDKLQPSAMSFTAAAPGATPLPTSPVPSATGGSPATGTVPTAAPDVPLPAGAVPVTFQAGIQFAQAGSPWVYNGSLGVEQMSDGSALVHWDPTVINPQLRPGATITVQPLPAPASGVTDRNGKSLAGFASLAPLMDQLKAAAPPGSGTPGSAVEMTVPGQSAPVPLFTITAPKPQPALKLTLDATLQAAAEQAVKTQSKGGTLPASLVAVEPSTGNVLAIANAPANGPNNAFLATNAPGSTMKVITSAALLEAGDTPATPVACPPSTMVTGKKVANDFTDARPGNLLKDDFAQSCNTAFIDEGNRLLKPNTLPDEAKDVFGLGLVWKTGLTDYDTTIPVEPNAAAAATEFFGQGNILTNPLGMASVAATVQSGTFRQPVVVPGLPQVQAARRLPANVLDELRSLMYGATRDPAGTAHDIPGITPDVASKTGTAEVDGKTANSWYIGFRGNLAVACEVQGADFGAEAAGPAAVQVLETGNN
ncbi:hypothetical protein LN042_17425 [Kitasatospora sp. RB6PN24]|uniref:penicillin-binding transpeptidase domain-containing protein n=1 Tax=Kitasatospora humi TaxID=2893891 RepID=UPI001E3FC593|nr:penicillin-binding transpeptidase domain-containing protein [Kitasatospora humi]MCC9308845.1 hypothetical protein [Kitasatospora humi]